MTKQETKQNHIRKNLEKVKDADIKPWRMIVSIIVFIGALLTLPAIVKGSTGIWDFFAWFYLVMAAAAAVIDVIQGAVPLRFNSIVTAFLGYTYRLFMELVLIALCLPAIALMFILGPVMFLAFFVSLGCLVMYFLLVILKIDIKGVVPRESGIEALIELGVLLVSGFALFNLFKTQKLFEYLLGKIIDGFLFVERLGRGRKKVGSEEMKKVGRT
jgi:hypothetical protein